MQSINHLAGDLTLLYTETKKKALSSTGKHETIPTLSHLDRKLRIQKDRLMTWGLEWSDQDKGSGGDIDKSVESVGMTDTVTSVLKNIQEVLEQAEKIKSTVSTWSTPEKFSLSLSDEAKYQDLLKDLVDSIDTLYEISTTRRAIATGSHPTFSSDEYLHEYAPGTIASESTSGFKKPFRYPSFASSQQTLVNPSFARPNLSPYAGLPASLDVQALKLPAEAPPPYETFGVPSATRMIGRLMKSRVPESVRAVLKTSSSEAHVLVEYENYDPLYRDTGVPPPLQRLEGLAAALRQVQERKQRSLVLLGYFEDPQQPRIGLVYDFLGAFHSSIAGLDLELEKLEPVSLLNLIQTANKGAKPADITKATPFLEDRFHIALRLTESLKDLHAEGYSHGNLNSGSVIFFRQGRKPDLRRGELHRPTLSAFDMFSRTRIERGSNAPSINITKHPHDNDGDIDSVKAIQFDLYGLALLLLEIGLWTPLNDLYKAKYSLMDFKLRIEKLWVPKLASKCGSLYMRAVQACLRLSDDPDIGKIDPSKIYDSIVRRLQRCCLLDEDEPIFPEHTGSDQPWPWQIPTPVRQESLMSFASGDTVQSPALSTTSSYGQRHLTPLPNIATAMGHVQSRSTANPTSPDKKFSPSRSQASLASSLRVEEKFEDGISAADTQVQDAMRGSRSYPFREYRRKVVLIQSRWRECRLRRQMAAAQHDLSSRVGERQFGADESHLRKPEGQPRRSSDSISRKCQIFPIKLPQPALDDWHSNLGHRLSRIVERALKDSTESSSIDLVGFGQDPFTARPTILVTCASTARVKAALKRKFDYDRSLFDLKVRKGRISLARGKCPVRERLARRSGADDDDGESDYTAQNPFFQKRPLCGASIGAYLPTYGHLDPVSYGGVVMVEQEGQTRPYGMTVHHMLDPPDRNKECSSSEDESSSSGSGSSSGSDVDTSDASDLTESEDEEHDDAGYSSSEFESDVEDEQTLTSGRMRHIVEPGDKPGIKVQETSNLPVTQPAFRDAWDQDLHADDAPLEELDEDHLTSYKFGKVYASSGLRRMMKNGMRHEIDWALIELEPPRIQPYNLIQGGKRYCNTKATFCPNLEPPVCRQGKLYTADEDLYPIDIVPLDKLANLSVHCFGRTSGLQQGEIGAGMSFVKLRGRRNFSSSWSAIGGFGVGGDSGAWVIDNASGRVCGHVLAERDGMAYICSMELLFQDIKATLGATSISLPGSDCKDGAVLEYATSLTEDIAGAVAKLDLVDASSASAGRSRSDSCRFRKDGKHVECGRLAKEAQARALRT